MEHAIENMFFSHIIFTKIKREKRKPYAKKMHFYSGEISSASSSISIFEKLSVKNRMGLTWLKRKILTSI